MKPIIRWTMGKTSNIGVEILQFSVKTIVELYGDLFDYYVCFNGVDLSGLDLPKVCLLEQSSQTCPIPVKVNSSLWKFCPPRLRIESHEIFIDNDIVLLEQIPQITEFLASNRPMISEGGQKYYGIFDELFQAHEIFNAGFIGVPPGFDLKAKMIETWRKLPCFFHPEIMDGDEQGMIASILKQHDPVFVPKSELALLRADRVPVERAKGYHFLRANVKEDHLGWAWFRGSYGD